MMNKLSPRERILALLVAALIPMFVLFGGYSWFTSALDSNDTELRRLRAAINQQKVKQATALAASERRHLYRWASLPSNVSVGYGRYQDWLFDLAQDCQLRDPALKQLPGLPKRLNSELIYDARKVGFEVVGSLEQIVEFLYRFEQKQALHRISSFQVNPVEATLAGRRADADFNLILQIDVIFLPDADQQTELPAGNWPRLARTLEEYKQVVVGRNIFGPPNEAPTISSISAGTMEPGQTIRLPITASDDSVGGLEFELTSSSCKDAQLEVATSGRSATFVCPGLEDEGRYEFEVQATDHGFPRKSSTRSFTIRVQEPDEEPVAVSEPPVPDAELTRITALTRNAKLEKEAWLYIQSQGVEKIVTVGETFTLDGKRWVLHSHDFKTCVFECDGKLLKFKRGSRLSEPVASEPLLVTDRTKETVDRDQ